MAKLTKSSGLEVHLVDDGYVIYDEANDRVHYLNATSALVWELADGSTDVAGLAALTAQAFDLDESPLPTVADAVGDLRREGLLVEVADA